ncbi:cysteine hydrolase family protein [Candidatus Thiosymbion oneisti]|uniref:cysteine hydrolase family protein n=1 Tax=Candidatus Thiosymbion oneisti TaxID=589554 RepID=UPI000B7EE36B|nr:isochorismatase family cysteine hydrolase [Candidatus Thiosymbion oneisti]
MKTGLVIIDMLNDFQDGVLANPAADEIVEPLKRLIDAARANDDWVVIYGNDAHKPGDLEFEVFGEHAVAGTHGAAVIDAIAPQEGDEIVNKRYYSTFTETDLDSICKVYGIDRLVIVGQHTDCCVRHTSYDAYVRGLKVVVVSDATCVFAPLSEQPHQERNQAALDYLKTIYGARIVSTDKLLSEMK